MDYKRKNNIFVISLLRILACFLIVRDHYHNEFGLHNTILKGVILGAGPVAIFFVISGYLAYYSFSNNIEKNGVKNYYIKRASRIIPSYYFVLILCIIVDAFWGIVSNNDMRFGWIRYFTFTNMLIPSKSFGIYNNLFGFWTMGCFPIFYLMVPLIYKCFDRKNGTYELLFGGIILNILTKQLVLKCFPVFGVDDINTFSNVNPFSTIYLFIFGMCVANGKVKNSEKQVLSALAIVLLLMLVFEKSGYVLWGLASAFICLSSDRFQLNENELSRLWYRVIIFLDCNSFCIYLTHLLVAKVVLCLIGSSGVKGCLISIVLSVLLSSAINKILSMISFNGKALN